MAAPTPCTRDPRTASSVPGVLPGRDTNAFPGVFQSGLLSSGGRGSTDVSGGRRRPELARILASATT